MNYINIRMQMYTTLYYYYNPQYYNSILNCIKNENKVSCKCGLAISLFRFGIGDVFFIEKPQGGDSL